MANKTIRVVTRESDGTLRTKDYASFDELENVHDTVGIDDCSTDLSLRGMPVFRGLIGPMPESKTVVRYESPDVFEAMTKEWSVAKTKRRRRRSSAEVKASGNVPAPAAMNTMPTMIVPNTIV